MQQSAIKLPDFLTYWSLTDHVYSQGTLFARGAAGRPGATKYIQLWKDTKILFLPATEIIVLYETEEDGIMPHSFVEGWWQTRVEPTPPQDVGWFGFDYTPRLLNELHESALRYIAGITI